MRSKDTASKPYPSGRPTQDEQLFFSGLRLDPEARRAGAAFTDTDPWRVLRIMGEFTEGFDALAGLGPAVTIFGSARVKPGDPQYEAAVEVARQLGEAGLTIITGGGPGIMEAGNKGAQQADALSVGLNVELPFEQGVNPYVDLALEFRYFFVRKTMFVKYAQGFVIFPGGFGTMDELFEALTLIQTGKVRNFPVVLHDAAYWDGLVDWLREMMLAQAKISPADLALPLVSDSVEETCDIILRSIRDEAWRHPHEASARQVTKDVLGVSSGTDGR
ncbi:MAG: TIGR00730 family Rossman fold protein [Chloroflexota bacterium]|jgi:hypothetical protein